MASNQSNAVSADDVKRFTDCCLEARYVYQHYQVLFNSEESSSLIRRRLHDFGLDLHRVLSSQIMLEVWKLTDNTKGDETLSIPFLTKNVELTTYSSKCDELRSLSSKMIKFGKKLHLARNKYITHNDRKAIHTGGNLGAIPEKEWALMQQKKLGFCVA